MGYPARLKKPEALICSSVMLMLIRGLFYQGGTDSVAFLQSTGAIARSLDAIVDRPAIPVRHRVGHRSCKKQHFECMQLHTELMGDGFDERTSLSLASSGITSVIWCIGFTPDFKWVNAPVLSRPPNR